MVKKRRFELPYFDGLVDLYLNGMKVHAGHPGQNEHIYLHVSPDVNPDVDIAPHDPRIGLEGEIKNGKVVKMEIERKFVTAGVDVRKDVVEPSQTAKEVMREIRRQTFDLEKNDEPVAKEPVPFKKDTVPVLETESKVGFGQEATVEAKSLEDYGSK